jgi:TPR repeat protein
LDERAQEAITKWRFQPGLKNGIPVKISANIEVKFRLIGANFDAELEKRRTQFNHALNLAKGDSKQAESALKTFQELAEKRFPPAMYVYAEFLAQGKNIPADPEKSRDLIERAAKAKYGPAMFALAMRSIETKDASRSFEELREMIHSAAVLGSAQAQYFMGSAYEHGSPTLSFRQDEESARQFYRLCAATGQMLCQFRLGELLLKRPDAQERDILQAIAWLELSAEQGDPEAKSLADQARPGLTGEQMKRITTLAQQLVHRN